MSPPQNSFCSFESLKRKTNPVSFNGLGRSNCNKWWQPSQNIHNMSVVLKSKILFSNNFTSWFRFLRKGSENAMVDIVSADLLHICVEQTMSPPQNTCFFAFESLWDILGSVVTFLPHHLVSRILRCPVTHCEFYSGGGQQVQNATWLMSIPFLHF